MVVIFLLRKFGDNVLPTLSSVLVSVSRGSSSCESGEYIFLRGEQSYHSFSQLSFQWHWH